MDAYQRINKLEVEVFLWRRGSTRVSFDLDKAFFAWTEISRWNRNFARSMQVDQIELLRATCREIDLLEWESRIARVGDEMIGSWYRAWSIVICIDETNNLDSCKFIFGGRDDIPDGFHLLSDVIRRICRQDFRVSE